ncbi:MAG: signal peptidase II [Planctomycetes bacterium]|nr:signal peptidase II [Planctomycetota bacterium]
MDQGFVAASNNKKFHYFIFIFLALCCATIDILSKDVVWLKMNCESSSGKPPEYVVIPNPDSSSKDYLQFNCIKNPGIIFGLFADYRNLFFVITIIAIPLIIFIFATVKKHTWTFTVALGFILAGTLGNVFDRIEYKQVRDFIEFEFLRFAVFNLADAFILVGMFILTLEMVLFEDDQKKDLHLDVESPSV